MAMLGKKHYGGEGNNNNYKNNNIRACSVHSVAP